VDSIECKATETYDAICRAVNILEKMDTDLRIMKKAKKIQGKADHAIMRLRDGASSARSKAKIYVGTNWGDADALRKVVYKDMQKGKKDVGRYSEHLFKHAKEITKIMTKIKESMEK